MSAACSRLQALADVQRLAPSWSRGRLKDSEVKLLDKALTEIVQAYEALGHLAEDPRRYDDALDLDPKPDPTPVSG